MNGTNEVWAVVVDGAWVFAGTGEDCRAVAANHNATQPASYRLDGRQVDNTARIHYAG